MVWQQLSDFRVQPQWFVDYKPQHTGDWQHIVHAKGLDLVMLVDARRRRVFGVPDAGGWNRPPP